MKRRGFLKHTSLLPLLGLSPSFSQAANELDVVKSKNDREYWVHLLDKIATPVLSNMSQGLLRKNMKIEYSSTYDGRNKQVAYMEAFGRLLAGIAPFLALPSSDATPESKIRQRLLKQTLQSLAHGANSKSPDYLYWGDSSTRQPLVDAAHIAQAFLLAPKALWEPLSQETKLQWIYEFKRIRQIEPFDNNWVLFAAIIESFLLFINEEVDEKRIDNGIDTIQKWYVGDGWYRDGSYFHFDHYNGYVIHPMLVDVLRVNVSRGRRKEQEFNIAYKRMQRYASFLERYISPEGTYLVVGRSSTYRVGAFQPLVKLALEDNLPNDIKPAQVRCALTAVMKNLFVPETFTKNGWLTLGLVGSQQAELADYYSNTGSMYVTSLVFLPLGLPSTHEFWSAPFTEWDSTKSVEWQTFSQRLCGNLLVFIIPPASFFNLDIFPNLKMFFLKS